MDSIQQIDTQLNELNAQLKTLEEEKRTLDATLNLKPFKETLTEKGRLFYEYMEAQKHAYDLLKRWRDAEDGKKGKHREVIACYDLCSTFEVPDDVDLEGDEVKDWWVKYDTLHVVFKDETREELEIEARCSALEDDLKRPDHTYICNDDDRELDDEELANE